MAIIENKWKKLKTAQRICMTMSILSWLCVVLPVVMDMAGVAIVTVFFNKNAWLIPSAFIFAVGFTITDLFIGYRVQLHEEQEKNKSPIIHHKRRHK